MKIKELQVRGTRYTIGELNNIESTLSKGGISFHILNNETIDMEQGNLVVKSGVFHHSDLEVYTCNFDIGEIDTDKLKRLIDGVYVLDLKRGSLLLNIDFERNILENGLYVDKGQTITIMREGTKVYIEITDMTGTMYQKRLYDKDNMREVFYPLNSDTASMFRVRMGERIKRELNIMILANAKGN